jgi:flagellar FliL protein
MAGSPGASEEKSTSAASSGSSGGGKLVAIVSIVNLIATFAMLAFMGLSFVKDKKHPVAEDISAHTSEPTEGEKSHGKEEGKHGEGHGEVQKKKLMNFGKMVTLEQFTINLSTPGSLNSKYVRVNISLEVPNDDTESEVTSKMPQIRNVIIDLFNSKRPADLATADGRDFLKEEIRNALNNFLVSGKIKGVFFTNFSLSS